MKTGFYDYRGLPCTVANGKYSICGVEQLILGDFMRTSSGVLEWCTSKQDAETLIEVMRDYPQFKLLYICIDQSIFEYDETRFEAVVNVSLGCHVTDNSIEGKRI